MIIILPLAAPPPKLLGTVIRLFELIIQSKLLLALLAVRQFELLFDCALTAHYGPLTGFTACRAAAFF